MCCNPFRSIIASGLELVHVYDEALRILREYRPCSRPRISYTTAGGLGCAATEAPRGVLFSDYRIDDAGKIAAAPIIPPTS